MRYQEIKLMLEELQKYFMLLDMINNDKIPYIKKDELLKEINFILDTLKKIAQ